jgi:anti-anti-sigma factor
MNNASVDQAVVTVSARPGEPIAYLRMAGEVDIAAEPALADAVDRLHAVAPRTVVVDLAAVTFACSALVNFVIRVRRAIPDGASVVLCRPTPTVRCLLSLLAMNAMVALPADLPPQFRGGGRSPEMPGPATARGVDTAR